MRNPIHALRLLPVLSLTCLVVAGCGGKQDAAAAAKGPAPTPVVTIAVEKRSVPVTLQGIGNVEALASVAVKSLVDGQITAVLIKDGQNVSKGQPLFKIDSRPFDVQLQQAQANLARDKALLEIATAQEQRYRELLARHFISPDNYAQVKGAMDSATAAVQTDDGGIANARLQLEYANIRAPIAGRLGKIALQQGNLVKANDTNPLVTLNQLDPIYVSFSIPEQQLAAVREAMAKSRLDVIARNQQGGQVIGDEVHGKLSFIDNAVDNTTGTIKLRATFDNGKDVLWPGQFVSVILDMGVQDEALAVPVEALQTGPKGPFVYVVNAESKADLRSVTVARSTATMVVVSQGLEAGEDVVIDGQSRLTPGAAVAASKGGKKTKGAAKADDNKPLTDAQ